MKLIKRNILIAILIAALTVSSTSSFAESFVVPFDAQLSMSLSALSSAGADSEFGIVQSGTDLIPLFSGLPNHPQPTTEVAIGQFHPGDVVNFYIKTDNAIAFSFDTTTFRSLEAFSDRDHSLGFGGRIIEQTSQTSWFMHLDDAISGDDDDNDAIMQIVAVPGAIPEPSAIAMLLFGLTGIVLSRAKGSRKIARHPGPSE
jgi:hypothetical protein